MSVELFVLQERLLLPLILDPTRLKVGLAGEGVALERRRAVLTGAGVEPQAIAPDATDTLSGLRMLFIAGAGLEASTALAARARAAGVLVNVEDVPSLCDFHVPAILRRGDLLLTVSSAGRSPGLVKVVREWLETHFGSEWAGRVDEAGDRRDTLRASGLRAEEIAAETRALVERERWLS